jgi:hypothetical protein
MIDALEPRRLLAATFNGTEAADSIRVTVSNAGATTVTINGGAPQTGTGTITINALGGNDIVYFPKLLDLSNPPSITINLGDGDDYATNFDNQSGTGSLEDI